MPQLAAVRPGSPLSRRSARGLEDEVHGGLVTDRIGATRSGPAHHGGGCARFGVNTIVSE